MYPEHMAMESGVHLFGYIQSVSLHPMIITMWMEADLPLYMDMALELYSLMQLERLRGKFSMTRDPFFTIL